MLEVIGDRWSVLIIDAALRGTARFSDFRRQLDISSDVLSGRLRRLVELALFEKQAYKVGRDRARVLYSMTDAGRALTPILLEMRAWQSRIESARS
ncbi:winged helix-turn-helix transcriptional regulator [Herbiconiux sp. P17]|uniref:winged helix-turn-helix transcriptional regulator n=1 Tax=Herbiconiux wuyangfengii TaxID=3342794 RepID=UPI0035B81C1C